MLTHDGLATVILGIITIAVNVLSVFMKWQNSTRKRNDDLQAQLNHGSPSTNIDRKDKPHRAAITTADDSGAISGCRRHHSSIALHAHEDVIGDTASRNGIGFTISDALIDPSPQIRAPSCVSSAKATTPVSLSPVTSDTATISNASTDFSDTTDTMNSN
ncbi:hypothetical protein FPQ18DRAFT_307079 [Pyronema domesticum]|uniref:Uncharacterized protein n=1 Tax=Pyronema omphalodes (strain CBS 100304) TaxID=1076935 RepID=U4LAC7_PYROM|nr:hypothetical protein FPQ18DRAFT_307079 [Pyronema domesticum]CCX10688.1 Protein of unknown function [Pyronema omphalodes CBS 100304]